MGGCGRDPRAELHKFRHDHPHIEQMLPERRKLETSLEVMNFIDLAYH
jgi:hypothetical protein